MAWCYNENMAFSTTISCENKTKLSCRRFKRYILSTFPLCFQCKYTNFQQYFKFFHKTCLKCLKCFQPWLPRTDEHFRKTLLWHAVCQLCWQLQNLADNWMSQKIIGFSKNCFHLMRGLRIAKNAVSLRNKTYSVQTTGKLIIFTEL